MSVLAWFRDKIFGKKYVAPEPVVTPEPQVTESKPVRARSKGKFVDDNPATPEKNEAWVGGKSPSKKSFPKKKKT
jgi:hypothetical protein